MLSTEFVYYGPCSYGASGYDLHMFCAIACQLRGAVKFVNFLLGWSCVGSVAVGGDLFNTFNFQRRCLLIMQTNVCDPCVRTILTHTGIYIYIYIKCFCVNLFQICTYSIQREPLFRVERFASRQLWFNTRCVVPICLTSPSGGNQVDGLPPAAS